MIYYNCPKDKETRNMKLETMIQRNSFVNSIKELRDETNHPKTFIERWQFENLKWIWRKAHNRKEAKSWMKVELGW